MKYTVVMDWDSGSDRGADDAPVFHVVADTPHQAREVAEVKAYEQYGDEAGDLYGVVTLEGHAPEARG